MVFRSLLGREKEKKERIHKELTDKARERLSTIIKNIEIVERRQAIGSLSEEVGLSELSHFSGGSTEKEYLNFFLKAETKLILSYLEHLFKIANDAMKGRMGLEQKYSNDFLLKQANKIRSVLEEEGILWEIVPSESGFIEFNRLASQRQKESDEELKALPLGEEWRPAFEPYDKAYALYKEGKYGKEIPEKLYNSIEKLLELICVEKEGWSKDSEANVSEYLEILKNQDIFSPNNIMPPELEDMLRSMEKTFSKVGQDRKHRHEHIDKYYCNLLLHQTSAYLYFIIKRYKAI